MKVAFGTVIYKQAREYFDDLMYCVFHQTDSEFDVLIVNDNYSKDELKNLNMDADVFVDLEPRHVSIAQTRIEMIRAAKEAGYDLLVVSDADDTFALNRIEEYKKAYRICLKEGRKVPELPVNAGEYVLYEMWQKSIKEDTRRLELDRCLTPDTAKEFISAMRAAGINNFVFTAKRGAVMNNIMVFLNEGCRMEGNTTLIKHGRKKTKSVDGLFFVFKCREYIKIRVTNKSEEDKNGNIIYTVAAGEGQDALCVRVKYSKKDNLMSVVETPPDLTDMEFLELIVSRVGNYRVTQEIGAMTASVLKWSMENNRDNL